MDVVTAFLNGDLNENIYMSITESSKNQSISNKVCKLHKSPDSNNLLENGYAKMHSYLVNDLGFLSSKSDLCLYVNHSSASLLMIGLYVDDLLIPGSIKGKILKIKKELKSRFEMKGLGQAQVMLGIEISRDRTKRQLFISQREYTDSILAPFGMENSRSVATPMDSPGNSSNEHVAATDASYSQAFGRLVYQMIDSCPDLGFVVGKLSQYSETLPKRTGSP